MNTQSLVNAVTKTLVILVFWFVFGLSAFLEPELNPTALLYILAKALLVSGIFWVILFIVNDTLIKSMIESAKESKADRFQGGISYHLVEPSAEEKAWQEQHRAEEGNEKVQ